MTFTANQIAVLINGKIEGDPNNVVRSFGRIEEAKQGQLAFLPTQSMRSSFIPLKPLS
jgi:UDP-3-O-[3-hydroxymyristoyl] glucosamine N-acyltransferase